MLAEEVKNVLEAIEKTRELFIRRNSDLDWQRNLVEGSANLKSPMEFGNFYKWLACPEKFKMEKDRSKFEFGFSDQDKKMWEDYKYPDGMYEKVTMNGNQTQIHVTRMQIQDDDDEKTN